MYHNVSVADPGVRGFNPPQRFFLIPGLGGFNLPQRYFCLSITCQKFLRTCLFEDSDSSPPWRIIGFKPTALSGFVFACQCENYEPVFSRTLPPPWKIPRSAPVYSNLGRRDVFGSWGGDVPTRPNCKLFTCQLVLVAAAPVLQDFHPGEKTGGGGCPPVPTALRTYPRRLSIKKGFLIA